VRISHLLAASIGVMVVAPAADAAELNGQIRGVVVDSGGLPIPGAAIVVTSPNMLGDRSLTSDADGRWRAPALAPGEYAVQVEKPGFSTYRTQGIRIVPGGTITLEAGLDLAGEGEEILVLDEAPIVDVERTQTGVNLTADMMRDLPSTRSYQGAASVAPGVVGGGNPNMHGGFDSSNQYFIDGVNTTDPVTSTFSTNMNFDAIQEVQVITGGMDAEYGQSLGGAINVVTKSGGNELEAQVTVEYADQNFEIYEPLEGEDPDASEYSSQSYALNIGGPIVRDKLWYFANAQIDVSKDSAKLDPGFERPTGPDPVNGVEMATVAPQDWKSYYLFGKLTWQPSSEHRVWVHGQADPAKITNVEQSAYVLPSAEAIQTQGSGLGSVGHLWMPNDRSNLETQVFYTTGYLDYYSVLWEDCQQFDANGVCQDDFGQSWTGNDYDDFSLGEQPYAYLSQRSRASVNTAYTRYVDALGSHEFKVGAQVEWLKSWDIWPGIEDGIEYWTDTGDPLDLDGYEPVGTYIYDNDLDVTIVSYLASAFVQDVWQPFSTLTLRPGLRIDHARLQDDGGNVRLTTTDLQPRIGAAWDVFGDQMTNLHAYYGRFTAPGDLGIASLLKNKSEGYGYYGVESFDAETGEVVWSEDAQFGFGGVFLQHTNLHAPYSDEFNLGVTRALSDVVSVDVTWVHEVARNFWEDDEVNLIWDETGSNVIGNRNGSNEAVYRLTTSDDLYTKYNSVEFVMMARLDEWWAQASYTWAEATGTSDSQGATAYWDIAEQRQFSDGYLSYDITHNVKLHGVYDNRDAWSVGSGTAGYLYGWDLNLRSGYPYRRYYYNEYYSGAYNWEEINDGSLRLPAFSQLDLRAGVGMDLGPVRTTLIADCYNVFNSRGVTGVDETWEYAPGEYNTEFGDPIYRQDPRRFGLTLRGEF